MAKCPKLTFPPAAAGHRLRRCCLLAWLATALACISGAAQGQAFPGLAEAIAGGGHGSLKAVLVARDGELLYEGYFRGAQAADLRLVNSVTKSIGSALIGIAHRQGALALDQDIGPMFAGLYPMHQNPYAVHADITVEQVLQMRHGVVWDEWTWDYRDSRNDFYQALDSGDWYRYFLRRPAALWPEPRFAYSTAASNLMGRMLRWSTGTGARQFLEQQLFAPLGINDYHWEGWSEGGRGNGLVDWPNPDDDPPLGFGLWLSARDLLRFGELYRNGGVHEGRRILDADWIEASWRTWSNEHNDPQFADSPGGGYGYQWWATRLVDDLGRGWEFRYANGWGRQFVMIAPDLDLVVVSLSDDYDWNGPGIGALLREYILPELAPSLDARFDGAWYDPDTSGQGLTLQVLDDGSRLIGFWYTWDTDGARRWFTLDGPITGEQAEVTIRQAHGGRFLAPDPVMLETWGTGRFSTVDCNHVRLELDTPESAQTIELTRLSGRCSRF